MDLAAINWRSPVTWLVIIGGGVAVFFLVRAFQNKNAATTDNTAATVPAVGTSLFLETPADTTSATPTTTPSSTPDASLTATYAQIQAEAQQENASLAQELQSKVNQGYTITGVPSGVTLPTKQTMAGTSNTYVKTTNTKTTRDYDNDRTIRGGGVPDTSNYIHVSTWPYGGQKLTTRLA